MAYVITDACTPPLAPARGFPRLPRFACAALRCAPSFPLAASLRYKGGRSLSPCLAPTLY
jgi:hypothetical protein